MVRKIIKIDEANCDGCGACVTACHEGAIGLIDGKAKLLRDDYCDGLGNCLPACHTGAITFEEREAAEFDEAAVRANLESEQPETLACGCPGQHSQVIKRESNNEPDGHGDSHSTAASTRSAQPYPPTPVRTQLNQWPVQIKLVPLNAPYFDRANLLIAADCAAYAYGDFHTAYMKNRITLIGCPKLDEGDYSEKLTAILTHNNIKSVTVVRMEVPCCGGIENAVMNALRNCGKMIPWQVVTISTDGRILDD